MRNEIQSLLRETMRHSGIPSEEVLLLSLLLLHYFAVIFSIPYIPLTFVLQPAKMIVVNYLNTGAMLYIFCIVNNNFVSSSLKCWAPPRTRRYFGANASRLASSDNSSLLYSLRNWTPNMTYPHQSMQFRNLLRYSSTSCTIIILTLPFHFQKVCVMTGIRISAKALKDIVDNKKQQVKKIFSAFHPN